MSQKVRLVRSVLQPLSLAINVASYFSDANSINLSFNTFSKLMAVMSSEAYISNYSRINT